MNSHCDICNDAGTLRDGSACPSCSMTRWRAWGHAADVVRPKRQAWVRPSSLDRFDQSKPASDKPATKAR